MSPSAPRLREAHRFQLCLSADGKSIELKPYVTHLTEIIGGGNFSAQHVPSDAELLNVGSTPISGKLWVPQSPVAEQQTTAELDAYEASFFDEDDLATDYADIHDPLLYSCKKGSGVGSVSSRCRREFQHGFQPPPRLPARPSRWELLLAKLFKREGHWVKKGAGGNASVRGRRLTLREIKRWEQRHGAADDWRPALPWDMREQGVLLRQEARRCSRVQIAAQLYQRSQSTFSRSAGLAPTLRGLEATPAALLEPPSTSYLSSALPPNADQVLAQVLGLDEASYRMIKALETRDIRPEDYELLGRLDENIKPKTLDAKQLALFPTEIFTAPQPPVCSITKVNKGGALWEFGFGFWSLPLQLEDEDEEEDDDEEEKGAAEVQQIAMQSAFSDSMQEACGVCLLDFESGDELRKLLPCGHRFHKDCIDRWLLEASTTCPVDKGELSFYATDC